MSVPPDMMSRIAQDRGSPMPGGGMPGPSGTPMATPQKKEGKEEIARVQVHVAMNMLEQALPALGAESKEGRSILKVLSSLAKDFGETDTSDLVPAQMKEMVAGMPQMGGGSPQQQQILKMMQANAPARIPPAPAPMPMPQ